MKSLFLSSIIISLLIGFIVGFSQFVSSVQVKYKYEPPLSQEEMQKMRDLTVAAMEATLASRRVPYTRKQWLVENISYGYFWKAVAMRSWLPTLGIFAGCMCVGILERRRDRARRSHLDTTP